MDLDPANAVLAVQNGWAQLSALAVSYSMSVLGAIVLVVAGWIIAGLAERSVHAGLGRIPTFDQTLRDFFSKIVRYALLALVFIMVLGQFGVQTASIIAAIGAIGLAIGLALQGTLQNIAAGIMLLVLRPMRVGEYVDVGGVAGTIEEIGLFATRMKTFDGLYRLAPNSTLWNQPVTNYSRNPTRRNEITIGIGYDDDIAKALDILMGLARGDSRVLPDPAPQTFVAALGDSAVNVTLRYWTLAGDFFPTGWDLTNAAKASFDGAGISIPFPQREVIVHRRPETADGDQAMPRAAL